MSFFARFSGFLFVIILFLTACNSGDETSQIDQLKQQLEELSKAADRDPVALNELVFQLAEAYEKEAQNIEEEGQRGEMIFLAAENYESSRTNLNKAINLYQDLANNYTSHPRHSDALFKLGFIYNNTLQDTTKARNAYNKFIEMYPNDELADDAQWEIDNLGISDDELLRRIQEKANAEAGESAD